MICISAKDAKSLAVTYAAYQVAFEIDDYLGVCVWGDLLIESQVRTGIELSAPDLVRRIVARARDMRKLAAAA